MTAFHHLLAQVTRPDNLPVAGMVVALGVIFWVWGRQARRNDHLVALGREEDIGPEMRR